MRHWHAGVGFYNRNVGPWLYIERGGFMLHLYARWFRDPWDHGFRWHVTLRLRDRYRIFWGG